MADQPSFRPRAFFPLVWPVLLALFIISLAVGGAALTSSPAGPLNAGVESLAAAFGNLLGDASTVLPLGFAFGAGMVSAVNPCGFAMLPAYLGLYLSAGQTATAPSSGKTARNALVVGSTVTLGFVLLFTAAGLAIAVGAQPLVAYFPWIGLGLGVVLVGVGAWVVSGRGLYTGVAERVASRIGGHGRRGLRGYFLFGLAYGIASLSCTLPIFLSIVGTSLTLATLPQAVLQFALYALGMGAVLMGLTLSMAFFRTGVVQRVRAVLPLVAPLSAVALLLAGAYMVYYWLTLGGLLRSVLP